MPTAKTGYRRRYRDPKGYQDARVKARTLAGYEGKETFEEPPYDDVKVVTLTNPAGEKVRVTEDQVEAFKAAFAEQAEGGTAGKAARRPTRPKAPSTKAAVTAPATTGGET